MHHAAAFSPSPLSRSYSTLRVFHRVPGRSDGFSAGLAGRGWPRRGAGVGRYSSSLGFLLAVCSVVPLCRFGVMPSGWRSSGHASCARRRLEMVLLLAVLLRMEPDVRSDAIDATPSIKLEVEAPNWRDLELSFFYSGSHGDLLDEAEVLAAPCSDASWDLGVHMVGCTLEASSHGGVPQRRHRHAGVILGESSHSTPGRVVLPWFLFLLAYVPFWRIFIACSSGSITDVAPSGMFPGGGAGARSWRFTGCGGENQGLDCFSLFSCRALSVKHEAHVVFSYVLTGLTVTLYRPLVD